MTTNVPENLKFDKRVVARHVGKGIISQAELDARLEALPDLAGEAEQLKVSMEHIERKADQTRRDDREDDPELID